MAKADHKHSILQDQEKFCWVTGARNIPLEKHHVLFGTGMRKIADKLGLWVWLTPEMHRGDYGVHGKHGHELDLRLKREVQAAFEKMYGHDAWMKRIGRNYLEE